MTIFNNDSTLDFGKYKGRKLCDVALFDACYLWWCEHNIKWFNLDVSVRDLIERLAREERYQAINERRSSRRTTRTRGSAVNRDWTSFDSDFGGYNGFW